MSHHTYSGVIDDLTGYVRACGFVSPDTWTPGPGQSVKDTENDGMPQPSYVLGGFMATVVTKYLGGTSWDEVPQP
jgi:hypothetical protein